MKISLSNIIRALLLLVVLSSCASQPTKGPDYYLLSSSELVSQALNLKSFKLAVGPIEVPVHLDREGIVTHESQNRLNYSDNHRWAEPLNENLRKTLRADLSQLLPNQQLIDFPYRQSNRPDYQLSVTIEKFGYLSEGKVVLIAQSTIVNAKGKQLDASYIKLERSGISNDPGLIVSTMSELLGEMAVQLAGKLSDKV